MDDNFLLDNQVAEELYHKYAKEVPIFDYHCHLSPKEIAEDKPFDNIAEIWLSGDHYKWRAMRSNGIQEKFITGDSSNLEKFNVWAKTLPYCIGNPLYHWTHLELKRYFGIKETLNEENARKIWEKCNQIIKEHKLSPRKLIEKSNVKILCTTDDPIDSLEYHKRIKEDSTFNIEVYPAFRPDKGLNIDKEGYEKWVEKLSEVSKTEINDYYDFLEALKERVEYFDSLGCFLSDHALDDVEFEYASDEEVNVIFKKKIRGEKLTQDETKKYRTATLLHLGELYSELGWVMQLHIGAMRDNNTRMYRKLGPDTGFDSINDGTIAYSLSKILDSLDVKGKLPKTVLYCLNPRDNYLIGTMIGNFQGDGIPGKIQFGTAWWFNDQRDGMEEQMRALANLGVLGRFIGMTTDSRSFLSYTRHEYFRRILCNVIGKWVTNGEYPYNLDILSKIIKDISFYNAKEYFKK